MNPILIIISILLIVKINSFKCNHNVHQHEIKIVDPIKKLKNVRNLASTQHPIKIYVDFEILENQLESGKIDQEFYSNLSLGFNTSIDYISKLISVNGPQSLFIESYFFPAFDGPIIQSEIPKLINTEIKADLIIIPKIFFEDDGSHGESYIISLNQNDNRPIIGGITLRTHYNFNKINSQFFIVMLLLHDITHILGFDSNVFPYFKSGSQLITRTINGVEKQLFTGKNVIKYAKKHFNCDNIEGIELENQVGGTHWEARIMLGDYMIGVDYSEIAISEISLALLEDSGWYKINYYTGGLFRYGKGEGCAFLNTKCVTDGIPNFPKEFCTNNYEEKCSSGYLNRGKCFILSKYNQLNPNYQYYSNPKKGGFKQADYCPISEDNYYYYYYNNLCDSNGLRSNYAIEFGEKYGDNSICIESSLVPNNISNFQNQKRTMCHEIKCNFENNTFIIYLGSTIVNCPGKYIELTVDGYSGSIFCPDFDRVCTASVWCTNPLICIDKKSKSIDYDFLNNEEENLEEIESINNENDEIEGKEEFENIDLNEEETNEDIKEEENNNNLKENEDEEEEENVEKDEEAEYKEEEEEDEEEEEEDEEEEEENEEEEEEDEEEDEREDDEEDEEEDDDDEDE